MIGYSFRCHPEARSETLALCCYGSHATLESSRVRVQRTGDSSVYVRTRRVAEQCEAHQRVGEVAVVVFLRLACFLLALSGRARSLPARGRI